MKASEVQKGDVLMDPATRVLTYTVEGVTKRGRDVIATVRFSDGGDGERLWDRNATVPLTRPEVTA